MHIKGVIFDLDGVICSTDRFHCQAWKSLADRLGIEFNETINNRLRGVSRMESLNIILQHGGVSFGEDEKLRMAEDKNVEYRKLLMQMSEQDLPEEVHQTLLYLRNKGYKLAIGSSSKNTKMILEKIGLKDFFDAVSDGTNISRSKPDPEVFLLAAEMIGLSAKECIVVEDAISGIDAATAGGFQSAGVGEASTHEKVTWKLKKVSDLMSIL